MDYNILFRFVLCIIFVFIESYFTARWNSTYYKIGIPIYHFKIKGFKESLHINLPDILTDKLKRGKSLFHPFVLPPSLVFYKFDSSNIAFRQKMFEVTTYNFPPVMRGLIKIDESSQSIKIIGLMNWYIIMFYIIYISIVLRMWNIGELNIIGILSLFIIFPLVIFLFCYLFQISLFNKVADQLKEWNME